MDAKQRPTERTDEAEAETHGAPSRNPATADALSAPSSPSKIPRPRAPSTSTAALLPGPGSVGVEIKERKAGGDDSCEFSFPSKILRPRGPSASTAALLPLPGSAGVENQRAGEDAEERHSAAFFHREQRRGETGGFSSFADADPPDKQRRTAPSSSSTAFAVDDFYAWSARVFAPSVSTAPKSTCSPTMEAWLGSQSRRVKSIKVTGRLRRLMRNVSAALTPQARIKWSPMGDEIDPAAGADTDEEQGEAAPSPVESRGGQAFGFGPGEKKTGASPYGNQFKSFAATPSVFEAESSAMGARQGEAAGSFVQGGGWHRRPRQLADHDPELEMGGLQDANALSYRAPTPSSASSYYLAPASSATTQDCGRAAPGTSEEAGLLHPPGSYKTELCAYWQFGACWNGEACRFAHGEAERRQVRRPPRYNIWCRSARAGKRCPYANRCLFRHHSDGYM